jgi:hypothetical protein
VVLSQALQANAAGYKSSGKADACAIRACKASQQENTMPAHRGCGLARLPAPCIVPFPPSLARQWITMAAASCTLRSTPLPAAVGSPAARSLLAAPTRPGGERTKQEMRRREAPAHPLASRSLV